MRGISILAFVLLAACGNGRQPQNRTSPGAGGAAKPEGDERIVAELNELRSNPAAYAEKINGRRQYYRGNVLRLPGQIALRTNEGVVALDEAVKALRALKPLPPLELSTALSAAARDHVRDVGPKGLLGHDGTDTSSPSQRARRYVAGFNRIGEVISFGPEEPSAVVIDLIVDDGVRERGHRKILLDANLRFAGAACGPHAVYRTMCVIDLADRVTERR
jgi:uncharacterized protein YkwD